jgi:hypothetical protein
MICRASTDRAVAQDCLYDRRTTEPLIYTSRSRITFAGLFSAFTFDQTAPPTAELAAVPALADRADIRTANGRPAAR